MCGCACAFMRDCVFGFVCVAVCVAERVVVCLAVCLVVCMAVCVCVSDIAMAMHHRTIMDTIAQHQSS